MRPLLAQTAATFLAAGWLLLTTAHAQIAVRNQGYVPFSDAPINYRSNTLTDPVTQLQHNLEAGKAHLDYEPEHGYLKSVLKLLQIPVQSQTLVFSKTSFQYPKISPEHPRALYFNDDVYVGSVHDGKAIEIVSFDPMQGAIFYLLDEHQVEKPTFQRAELDCTQCHTARRQFEKPAEQLLRYLLFVNETPLPAAGREPIGTHSAFAKEFSSRGPRDSKGRSLRDLDLRTRIFRYPCSYLIYSESFDALPEPAKGYVQHRLLEVLSGTDQSRDFAQLTPADRQAILEILLDTKRDLPQEWHTYATSKHLLNP